MRFLLIAIVLSACSTGPRTPIITIPITISCSWSSSDGGVSEGDCNVAGAHAIADESLTTYGDEEEFVDAE